jgi:hypothetical protein
MAATAQEQSKSGCEALKQLTIPGVMMEVSRAEILPAGPAPKEGPWSYQGPLPERCLVEGVLNKRVGADGKPYGIRFAFALPSDWNRDFLMQGGGEAALDSFDMLGAIVNWVERGIAPQPVVASGKAFPGRTRPLCASPKQVQYRGNGNTEKAENFECR